MTRYRLSEYLRLKHLGLLPKPIEPGTVVPERHQHQQRSNSNSNNNGIMDQQLPPPPLAPSQPSTSGTQQNQRQPAQENPPLIDLTLDEPQNNGISDPHEISDGLLAVSILSTPLPDSIPEIPPEILDQLEVPGHPVFNQMLRDELAGMSSMNVPMIAGPSSASTSQQIVVKDNSQKNLELAKDLEKQQNVVASTGSEVMNPTIDHAFSVMKKNMNGLREDVYKRVDGFQRGVDECQRAFQVQQNENQRRFDAVEENAAADGQRLTRVEENAAVGDQRLTRVEENAAVGEERLTRVEENAAVGEERLNRVEENAAVGDQRLSRVEENAAIGKQRLDKMKKSADRTNAQFKETKQTVADNCRRLKSVERASRNHENRLEEVEDSQDDYDKRLEEVEESQEDYDKRFEEMKKNINSNQRRHFDKLFEEKKAALEAAAETQMEKLVSEQMDQFKREIRVGLRTVRAELADSENRNEAKLGRLENKVETLEQNQVNRLPLPVSRRSDSGAGSSSSSGSGGCGNSGGSRRRVERRRIFQGQRRVSQKLNRPSVTDNPCTSGGSTPELERQNDSSPNTTPAREQTPSPASTRASTPETDSTGASSPERDSIRAPEPEVQQRVLLPARKRVRFAGKTKWQKGNWTTTIRSANRKKAGSGNNANSTLSRSSKRKMSGSGNNANSASATDDANVASPVKRPRGRPKGTTKRARKAALANGTPPAKRVRTRFQTEKLKRALPSYALRNMDDSFVQVLN